VLVAAAGAVAREASKYRDELFDLLNVHKEGYQRLTAGNATANGTEGAAGEPAAAAAAAAENGTEGAGSPSEGAAAEEPTGAGAKAAASEEEL
jgi:hypothetical protein